MTDETETTTRGTGAIPVLFTLAQVAELIDGQRKPQTVYRWNTASGGRAKVFPEPDLQIGGKRSTPLWREEVVLAVLEEQGLKVDKRKLNRIRKAQGHPAI
jgi:hypothetical protein